jgi:hypothetical protein
LTPKGSLSSLTLLSSSIVAVLIVFHCHCYVQYVIASCAIDTVAVLVGIIIISAVASLGTDVAIFKMYRCNDDRTRDGKKHSVWPNACDNCGSTAVLIATHHRHQPTRRKQCGGHEGPRRANGNVGGGVFMVTTGMIKMVLLAG